jgi:SET domain-containing protein
MIFDFWRRVIEFHVQVRSFATIHRTSEMTPVQAPRIDPQYTCFDIVIRRSKIHRYGVYAKERIPANRKVIEYTGMRLNRKDAAAIESGEYTYLFAVDDYWTLDGARGGSGAEIINHSCDPNLISRVMKGHVLYMSLRAIHPGEELTIDYNFADLKEMTPCSCGAKTCRGTIEKRKTSKKS